MTARTDGTLQQALDKFWQDRFTTYTATQLNIPSPYENVKVATVGALTATYATPAETITGTFANLGAIDGVLLGLGDRILVKDGVVAGTGAENGIYVVTTLNSLLVEYTRALDADTEYELSPGRVVTVKMGTVNANTIWRTTTPLPITIGATPIVFGVAPISPYSQRLARARWEAGRGKCRVVLRIRPDPLAPVSGADPYYTIEFYVKGGWSGNPQADGRYAMFFLDGPIYSNNGLTEIITEQITNYGASISSSTVPFKSPISTPMLSSFTSLSPVPPYNTRLKIRANLGTGLAPNFIVLNLDFYPLDIVAPPNPFPPKYTIHEETGVFPLDYTLDLQVMNATSTTQSGYIPLGSGHKSYATNFGWVHRTLTLTNTDLAIANFNPFELGLGRIRVNMKHRFNIPPVVVPPSPGADPFYEIQFDLDGGYFTRTSQGGMPGRWAYWDVLRGIPGASVFSTDGLATVVRDPNNPTLFTVTSSPLGLSNTYTLFFEPYIDIRRSFVLQPRFGITRTAGAFTFVAGDTLELTFIYFHP